VVAEQPRVLSRLWVARKGAIHLPSGDCGYGRWLRDPIEDARNIFGEEDVRIGEPEVRAAVVEGGVPGRDAQEVGECGSLCDLYLVDLLTGEVCLYALVQQGDPRDEIVLRIVGDALEHALVRLPVGRFEDLDVQVQGARGHLFGRSGKSLAQA